MGRNRGDQRFPWWKKGIASMERKVKEKIKGREKESVDLIERNPWNGIPRPFVFLVMRPKKGSPLFWQKYREQRSCIEILSWQRCFLYLERAQRRHLRREKLSFEISFFRDNLREYSTRVQNISNPSRLQLFVTVFPFRWIAQIYLLRLMSPFKRNERD